MGARGTMFQEQIEWRAVICFWDGQNIARLLLWSDFQACLDGYVPLSPCAGQTWRAAYAELEEDLQLKAVVFFQIGFDQQGFAERSWNLPLPHMAEIAGPGPDFGGGWIRLACRSQCPISWHASKLWDPLLHPGISEFQQMQVALKDQAMRLGLRVSRRAPVHEPVAPHQDVPLLAQRVERAHEREASDDLVRLQGERDALQRELEHRDLRLRSFETEHVEKLTRERFEHEQALAILQAQHSKLLAQQKIQRDLSESLREQVMSLQGQVENLDAQKRNLALDAEVHGQLQLQKQEASHEEALKQHIEVLEQRWHRESLIREQSLLVELEAERARFREREARLQGETDSLQVLVTARNEQVHQLSQRAEQLMSQTAEKFLQELEKLGMNFLVYHPGAGHVSIPVKDLAGYVENPQAYAANQCFVSEEHYRHWLEHYNDPRCKVGVGESGACGARIIRVDSPAKFVEGESDRCARHHSDRNIDAVLKFRPQDTLRG